MSQHDTHTLNVLRRMGTKKNDMPFHALDFIRIPVACDRS